MGMPINRNLQTETHTICGQYLLSDAGLLSANQRSTHQHLLRYHFLLKAKTSQRRRQAERRYQTMNRQQTWGLSGAAAIDDDDTFDAYHAAFAYLQSFRIVAARAIAVKTRFDSSSRRAPRGQTPGENRKVKNNCCVALRMSHAAVCWILNGDPRTRPAPRPRPRPPSWTPRFAPRRR